jgi:hypothetical protein
MKGKKKYNALRFQVSIIKGGKNNSPIFKKKHNLFEIGSDGLKYFLFRIVLK